MLRSTPKNWDLGRLRSFEFFTRTFAENKSLHWSAGRVTCMTFCSWNLTIRQRRRPWKRHLKTGFASFQTISRLSQVALLLQRRDRNLGWSSRERGTPEFRQWWCRSRSQVNLNLDTLDSRALIILQKQNKTKQKTNIAVKSTREPFQKTDELVRVG